MNKVLKLDEERIDFLIGLLIHFKPKQNSNDNDLFICKEILTDLRIIELDD